MTSKYENLKMKTMKVKLSALLLSLALIFASCGNKKGVASIQVSGDQANTGVSELKMMIVAKLSVKPERIKDFIEVAKEMIEKSNKEIGCTSYQLYQDPYDNSKFVFVEKYKNQSAVDSHFATDYFKAFGPKIGDLVTGPAAINIITVAKEVNQ